MDHSESINTDHIFRFGGVLPVAPDGPIVELCELLFLIELCLSHVGVARRADAFAVYDIFSPMNTYLIKQRRSRSELASQ